MVAAMPDAILALHVNSTKLRESDRKTSGPSINSDSNDLEQGEHPNSLLITAVDDSENVGAFMFDMSAESNKTFRMH